jgi:hypothetical protein
MKTANISCRRVVKSYDEIARLIMLYTATPDGSSAKTHMTLDDAMTRKKKTAVARGITATKIGEFVKFNDANADADADADASTPRKKCAILGGGAAGRRTRRRQNK